MRKQTEISSIFKNRDQDFSEAPSRASWKKLERRLDAHQRRNRMSFIRSFGMVAAILLLAVFVFLFSLFGNPNQRDTETAQVTQIELLSTQSIEPEAYKKVEFRLKHRDRMSMPIEEGKADNKLLVNTP